METREIPNWDVEVDDEDEYLCFQGGSDNDEGFTIYLPSSERQPEERERAISLIAAALNKGKVRVE